jgi:predicted ATPase
LPQPQDDEGRFAFFEAVTELLRAEAGQTPFVLVLDDLQSADEESLLLLEFVASEVAEMPVLIVALAREETPRLDELGRLATRTLQLGS